MFEHLKQLKEMYSILFVLITGVITFYSGYQNILDNIQSNTTQLESTQITMLTQIESTQITMLKVIVRDFEVTHKCKVSEPEWEEYTLNYSTLFDLKIKHKMISKSATWKPIERKENDCD